MSIQRVKINHYFCEGLTSREQLSFTEKRALEAEILSIKLDSKVKVDIEAALTYLGQFVSHDILSSSTGRIHRSPFLNMQCLYGDGLLDQSNKIDDLGQFIIGNTTKDRKEDLLRKSNGEAFIPDSRNDENLIISQLHLLFQKLHNWLVQKSSRYFSTREGRFESARTTLILIYQTVIVTHFLKTILDDTVYETYFVNWVEPSRYNDNNFNIPLEFSHAAYRFGHSMIRNSYHLNRVKRDISLRAIFENVGPATARNNVELDDDFVIEWDQLLSFDYNTSGNGGFQSALPIDFKVSRAMSEIPFIGSIMLRNIEAGERAKLPSGQDLLRQALIQFETISSRIGLSQTSDLIPTKVKEVLEAMNLSQHTPLWVYFLSTTQENGKKLGKFSSFIVAEIFSSAIHFADISIRKDHDSIIDEFDKAYKKYRYPGKENKPLKLDDLVCVVDNKQRERLKNE